MSERDHLSIGEVLTLLRDEYPDITVSKIRFLESRGLIQPERTPSGYRKFYDEDVERLRWILTQQKEHFLPLRVIRDRLDDADGDEPWAEGADDDSDEEGLGAQGPGAPGADRSGEVGAESRSDAAESGGSRRPAVALAPPPRPEVFAPRERTLTLSAAELAQRAGLALAEVKALERLGMISATPFGDEAVYDDEALAVAELAGRFKAYGVEPRHLRMYKLAAEREAGLYEQLLAPLRKKRGERDAARERAEELAALGEHMRTAMLRATLRDLLAP